MSRTAQFAVNAAANYGKMLVQIAAVFVLTPYIIAHIGPADFGLWSLVISWLGLLGLLDLGFGTGVVKYVAECQGSGGCAGGQQGAEAERGTKICVAQHAGIPGQGKPTRRKRGESAAGD